MTTNLICIVKISRRCDGFFYVLFCASRAAFGGAASYARCECDRLDRRHHQVRKRNSSMINSLAGKPGIPPILMGGGIGLAGLFCVVDSSILGPKSPFSFANTMYHIEY